MSVCVGGVRTRAYTQAPTSTKAQTAAPLNCPHGGKKMQGNRRVYKFQLPIKEEEGQKWLICLSQQLLS